MSVAETTTNEHSTAIQQAVTGPARLVEFLKDTRQEMRKVVTPTRDQVQSTTLIVIVTVFLFAAYFALVDAVVGKGIDKFFVWATTKH